MWQWCVCARAISLLYIHVPHVAYKPNCKVIHFLKYCNSYSIDHYCSYLHGNISYVNIVYYFCSWSVVLQVQLPTCVRPFARLICTPIATVVLFFFYYAACVDFSATFPAADLFATCYRYALAVKHG